MTRRQVGTLVLALLLAPLLGASQARAAEYSMATVARYVVDPEIGAIAVTVEVVFTNTTPNPPGQVSGFVQIDLAVHDGASEVVAEDASGSLSIEVGTGDGFTIASVKPRSRVGYNASVRFTLSYLLIDGVAAGVHARPQVVELPAWGFGTSSGVTVELPAGYAIEITGDPMEASTDGDRMQLTSGPIADPGRWLAQITATRPATYMTLSRSVPLASGTVDLQVRAWADDQAWGRGALDLLARALPILEESIGLPYTRVGPLVVIEVVRGEGEAGEPASPSAEILVAFDEPDFTLLHQAAHIWISEQLAADQWIREGLASHFAARAAAGLGVELPYAPAQRAGELEADALPLAAWGHGEASGAQDAYAHAASWAFVDRVATAVGEAHLVEAIGRVMAGLSAYDPRTLDPALPTRPGAVPVDTRRLLDQLAAVSGVDLGDAFGYVALGPEAALEIAKRAIARAAHDDLIDAAGDWGAPDAIRVEMAEWRFDEARTSIETARAWLVERDRVVDRIATAGLTTPDRLREIFMAFGGGPEATAELDAERAVVELFEEVRAKVAAGSGPLEVIGLVGGDDPRELLGDAALRFSAGELRTAAERLEAAALLLDRAPTDGLVRVATLVGLLAIAALLAGRSIRARRGSHYTAAR